MLEADPCMKGQVIVYGTPAEEEGGGKIKMIEKGVFDECDICMMVHPSKYDIPAPIALSKCEYDIVFHGEDPHLVDDSICIFS